MKKILLPLVAGLFIMGSALAMAAGSGGQSSVSAASGGQATAQKSKTTTAQAQDKLSKQVAQEKTKSTKQ